MVKLNLVALFGFLQLIPAVRGVKVIRCNDVELLHSCKFVSAAAGHQHMAGFVHHCACGSDRIFHRGYPSYCACQPGFAVHDGSVKFVLAFVGEHRALTGVKQRVVFKYLDGGHHGVHAAAAAGQHCMAGFERAVERSAVIGFNFRGDGAACDRARSAMHGQRDAACASLTGLRSNGLGGCAQATQGGSYCGDGGQ